MLVERRDNSAFGIDVIADAASAPLCLAAVICHLVMCTS